MPNKALKIAIDPREISLANIFNDSDQIFYGTSIVRL